MIKKLSFILVLWWLLLSACLGILLLGNAPRIPRPSLMENRMLSGFPELSAQSLLDGSFFSGIEDFLSDGFFGREDLISFTDHLTSLLDLRSQEQKLMAEEAETNRLLSGDAGEEEDLIPLSSSPLLSLLVPCAKAENTEIPSLVLHTEGGADRLIYSYPLENIEASAVILNTLRHMLGPEGEVHFLQPPVAAVARNLMGATRSPVSWESTMEEVLQSMVGEGVYIHNVPEILNDPLMRRERCYFFTDHHWSELGAWYCASAIARSRGYPSIPYEEMTYQEISMGKEGNREDLARLPEPLLPTRSTVVTHLTEETEIPLHNPRAHTYTSYINNTRVPWRRFTSGFGTERRALLISDSFGNCFLPYLLPFYSEVQMTDLRANYYDAALAGGTFRQVLALQNIDDIYLVLSTSNGVNSRNFLSVFPKMITD